MNTFQNIMENGAFAPKRANAPFSIIFQRRQKVLLWGNRVKGLITGQNYFQTIRYF